MSSSKLPVSSDYKAAAEELEREAMEAEAERSFTSTVLKKEINWTDYERSGELTKKDLGFLLDYDKVALNEQEELLQEKGVAYAQLFVKCLDKLRARDPVEYLIVIVHQLLARDEQRAQLFHRAAKDPQFNLDIFSPFLRILTSGEQYNPFTLHTASWILATLFASAPHLVDRQPQMLTSFVTYLSSRVVAAGGRDLQRVLSSVKALLKGAACQVAWIQEKGLDALSTLLHRETQNAQLIYQVGFCLWLASFNVVYAAKPMQDLGIIRKLVQIVKANVMEKVVRIAYAIFRNLLGSSESSIVEELIGHGMVGLTDTLSKRKFKDNDLMVDMEFVSRTLAEAIQKLSTFEIYHSEVKSKNLKESPVHTNEAFWRENIAQFETNNYQIVQQLISIVKDPSESAEVREIAAWDLGEFARFHPDGRRVVTKCGGKTALMVLMTDSNQKLAKAALLATQKIMVNNWEFLQKSSAAGVQSLVSASSKK